MKVIIAGALQAHGRAEPADAGAGDDDFHRAPLSEEITDRG